MKYNTEFNKKAFRRRNKFNSCKFPFTNHSIDEWQQVLLNVRKKNPLTIYEWMFIENVILMMNFANRERTSYKIFSPDENKNSVKM